MPSALQIHDILYTVTQTVHCCVPGQSIARLVIIAHHPTADTWCAFGNSWDHSCRSLMPRHRHMFWDGQETWIWSILIKTTSTTTWCAGFCRCALTFRLPTDGGLWDYVP